MRRHRNRLAIRLAIAPAALVSVLVGCGGSSDTVSDTAASETTTPAAVLVEDEVEVIPVTGPVFETVEGGQFDMGSIEGTDTVLWFWAPW